MASPFKNPWGGKVENWGSKFSDYLEDLNPGYPFSGSDSGIYGLWKNYKPKNDWGPNYLPYPSYQVSVVKEWPKELTMQDKQNMSKIGFQPDASYISETVAAAVDPQALRWTILGFTPEISEVLNNLFPFISDVQKTYTYTVHPATPPISSWFEKPSATYELPPEEQFKVDAWAWYTTPEIKWAFGQMGLTDHEAVYANPILKGQVEKVAKLYPGNNKKKKPFSGGQ